MTREELAARVDPDTMLADGLEDAAVGVLFAPTRVLYDTEKVLEVLMKRDGMSHDDAYEFFSFNIEGAYVGPKTPVFMFFGDDDDS